MAKKLFSIKLSGIKQLSKKTGNIPLVLIEAGVRELNMIGEEIMTDSKENFVPVDTGALRSTGIVIHGQPAPGKTNVRLVYGGRSAPYALHVHDTKKKYKNGKVWKYLEDPVKNRSGSIGKEIGAVMVAEAKKLGI